MTRLPLCALAVAALTSTLGCARPRYFQADTVTPAPGGLWIAGTEGVAAFSDGRTVVRRDYPIASGAPDWGYEPFSVPAGYVVMVRDEPWLFTRAADILRWGGGAWLRVPARLPDVGYEHPQLDFAAAAPDGSVIVQVHSDWLLWARPGEVGVRWATERTPGYLTWLGFEGGALHGLGWEGGSSRTLVRRAAPGRWDVLAVLGPERDTFRGVMRIPGGPLAAVWNGGLMLVEGDATPRFVPAGAVIAGHHPMHAPAPLKVPTSSSARPAASPAMMAMAVRPVAAGLQVAADAPPPDAPGSVLGVYTVEGHGPLLVARGARTGVFEITETEVMFTPCSLLGGIVGAAATPAGVRFVTRKAGLVALDPGRGCSPAAPEAIGP